MERAHDPGQDGRGRARGSSSGNDSASVPPAGHADQCAAWAYGGVGILAPTGRSTSGGSSRGSLTPPRRLHERARGPERSRRRVVVLASRLEGMGKADAPLQPGKRGRPGVVTIPGVGPVTASAILAGAPQMAGLLLRTEFCGRWGAQADFERWQGTAWRNNGRPLISLRERCRSSAGAAMQGFAESWLGRIIARKPLKLAAVALANKMARIAWVRTPTRGEVYRAA